MKVIVKARHMDLTPALRQHAEEKLGQAIMRIFDKPAAKIEIELSDIGNNRDGNNMECRVSVSIPQSKTIVITELDDDMYKAIDLAHDRLLLQIKRQRDKNKHTSRNRKEAAKNRAETARNELTSDSEPWESELKEFEESTGA